MVIWRLILFILAVAALTSCGAGGNDVRSRTGYNKMGTSSQAMTNNLEGADQAGAGFSLPGSEGSLTNGLPVLSPLRSTDLANPQTTRVPGD